MKEPIQLQDDLVFLKLVFPSYFKSRPVKTIPLSTLIKTYLPKKTYYNDYHLYSYCRYTELQELQEKLLELPESVGMDCMLHRIDPDASGLPSEVSEWFGSILRTRLELLHWCFPNNKVELQ